MTVSLMPLPYARDALSPHISAETLKVHHGAHHKGYVDKVNAAVRGTALGDAALEEIVAAARKAGDDTLFNSAAQAWNHGFYWHSLSPDPGKPSPGLAEAITRDFGSPAKLRKALADAACDHFGSGWAWLVAEKDALAIVTTHDADTVLTGKANPLLVIDVWEHAYYLDVMNKRPDHVQAVVDNLLDWGFASDNHARGSAWSYPG